eukprot:10511157-Heterocapsa_arctica.AAC.1
MEVTESKMEEKIEATRQTREICKDLLKEAQAVAEDVKYMDTEKEKKDQKDKESQIIAAQHVLYQAQEERDRENKREAEEKKKEDEEAAGRKGGLDKEGRAEQAGREGRGKQHHGAQNCGE